MGLSDVVSASGTTSFAQIGFLISFVIFTLVVLWALTRSKSAMHAAAQSVLSDAPEGLVATHERARRHGH
jgi:hypothetical protein